MGGLSNQPSLYTDRSTSLPKRWRATLVSSIYHAAALGLLVALICVMRHFIGPVRTRQLASIASVLPTAGWRHYAMPQGHSNFIFRGAGAHGVRRLRESSRRQSTHIS